MAQNEAQARRAASLEARRLNKQYNEGTISDNNLATQAKGLYE